METPTSISGGFNLTPSPPKNVPVITLAQDIWLQARAAQSHNTHEANSSQVHSLTSPLQELVTPRLTLGLHS